MNDCVFCKIASNDIKSDRILETSEILVFPDSEPKASVHLLIIPKKHYSDILNTPDKVWVNIKKVVRKLSELYKTDGFRLINNYGTSAMMEHMHVHFLANVDAKKELN